MKLEVHVNAFAYPGQPELLRDIHFSLMPGEILAVLGPNGVGKSTLIQCILGLLPCKQGSCLLDGEDLQAIEPKRLWRRVGYVPQAHWATSSMLIEDMVLLGRGAHVDWMRQPAPEDIRVAEKTMETLGIAHLRGKACHQVSGGELQLAYMARALAASPELLVIDEPESGLDYYNQANILEMLQRLSVQGIASLWITHFPQNALRIAHKALLLSPRDKALFGPAEEVLSQAHLSRAYGSPIAVCEVPVAERRYQVVFALDP